MDCFLTLNRSGLGFLLAVVVGIMLGLVSHNMGKGIVNPLIQVLQATPALLWVIPLVLILGSGNAPPMMVGFLVSLPLIYFSTQESLKLLTPSLLDTFKIYAPSPYLWLRELIRPIFNATLTPALTIGLALSLKSTLIGEWFGSKNGLGRRIQTAWAVYNILDFYTLTFLLILMILSLTALARIFAAMVFPIRIATRHAPESGRCEDEPWITAKLRGGIQLFDVSFSYGSHKIFVHFNLRLNPSQRLLVSGPSGCGKTTLAKLMGGLLKPHQGVIETQGKCILVFQEDCLLNHRDALGNVALPLWALKITNWQKEAKKYLDWVGLCEYLLFPDQMSGGMRKRLALARALAAQPDILILDEPLVNLHEEARHDLWNLIFDLQAKQHFSLMIISHYPAEIERHFDQHIRLTRHPNGPH